MLLVGPAELELLDYAGEIERVPAAGSLVENLDPPARLAPRMAAAVRSHLEVLAPQRKNALRQARRLELGLDVDGPVNLAICRRVLESGG